MNQQINKGGFIRNLTRILLALIIFGFLVRVEAPPAQLNNSTTQPTVELATVAVTNQDKAEVANQAPAEELPRVIEPVIEAPKVETPVEQPVVIQASHPTGCENYRNLANQYNWNVEVVLQIMHYESGCNPYAVGDQFTINGVYAPSCGLMQVRTLSSRPPCEALKDPATNLEWAYRIYQGQGYNAWSVCKSKVNCY